MRRKLSWVLAVAFVTGSITLALSVSADQHGPQGSWGLVEGSAVGSGGVVSSDLDLGTNNVQVLLDDGGLSEPGLAFASDPDTGIRYVTTGQFGLQTGGTTRMVVATAVTIYTILNMAGSYIYDSVGPLLFNDSVDISGTVLMDGISADLAVGSCTAGQHAWDTGGATVELCYCNTTNNWECFTPTTTNGPAD